MKKYVDLGKNGGLAIVCFMTGAWFAWGWRGERAQERHEKTKEVVLQASFELGQAIDQLEAAVSFGASHPNDVSRLMVEHKTADLLTKQVEYGKAIKAAFR